jgi:hypothetical protein
MKSPRWFNEGAPRFEKVLRKLGAKSLLPPGDYYACPCCLWIFPRQALAAKALTLEDVPPKALGGRELTLTCHECNHGSGADFDSHAERDTAFTNFFAGRDGRPLSTRISGDEVSAQGTAAWTEDGLLLLPHRKQNHPDAIEALRLQVREAANQAQDPPSFNFTILEEFNSTRANISRIRSAYLAAFATFGWCYILRPELDPVRAQLADGNAEISPLLVGYDPTATADRRGIKVVESPEDIRSVLVTMGQYVVFLPGFEQPLSCDELGEALHKHANSGNGPYIGLTGAEIPWPKYPRYLWDDAFLR